MKIVTAEQMLALEKKAAGQGLTSPALMANAGLAVANEIKRLVPRIADCRVVILIGPGNNGGDGLVAALQLAGTGAKVSLHLLTSRKDDLYEKAVERGIPLSIASGENGLAILEEALASCDIVLDALFGTGKMRPLSGAPAAMLGRVKQAKSARPDLSIVALDLPSGLNPDSGAIDASTLKADYTVTMAYPKLGFFCFPGADYTGKLIVADIGIPPVLANDIYTELLTADWARAKLPLRPGNSNKGDFGKVMVAAGSVNYIGAACLPTLAAGRTGAGLVTLATAMSLHAAVASRLIEATHLPLEEAAPGVIAAGAASHLLENLTGYDILVLGPGLGRRPETSQFVRDVCNGLNGRCKLVLDADALNILSTMNGCWAKLPEDTVITPHPGEMSRLLGLPVEEIQANRLQAALRAAKQFSKIVVLKGAFTVIANPDGRALISDKANPALATAGTGDVLAGAIGGLMAQGLSPFDAAGCGVYLHAGAGESLSLEMGDAGVLAGDLLPRLPLEMKRLKQG